MKKLLLFLLVFLPFVVNADDLYPCGDNAYYTYIESSKTLIISGYGPMKNYNLGKIRPPWTNYSQKIESVEISEGITHIGDYSFDACDSLTTISIPNSVKSIGRDAFRGTKWYDNQPDGLIYAGKVLYGFKGTMPDNFALNIEEGTLGIADWSFCDYKKMTSISFPNSLIHIGNVALSNTGLSSISFPPNLSYIGEMAFNNTPWDKNLPEGLIYIDKILYKYKGEMPENTSIKIKEGTVCIVPEAFRWCTGLVSVEIPDSVLFIGAYSFDGCTSLASLEIPDNVLTIESNAFQNCKSLASVIIGNGVTSIGDNAFRDCTGMTSLIIGRGVKNIGSYTFYNCSNLSSLTMYCDYSLGQSPFYDCSNIKELTFGCKSLPYLSNFGLGSCHSIEKVRLLEGVETINNETFKGCNNLKEVNFPNSLKKIGDSAFQSCKNLKSVVLNDGLISIGSGAFAGCNISTKSLIIPRSVEKIGAGVFSGSRTEEFIIQDSENTLIVGNFIISSDSLKSIYIGRTLKPETEKENDRKLFFYGLEQLTSVTVGEKVTYFDFNYILECNNLEKIVFEDGTEGLTFGSGWSCPQCPIQELYLGRIIKFQENYIHQIQITHPFSLTIGNTVTDSGAFFGTIFSESNINKIVVDPNNKIYDSREECNAVIETSTNRLLLGCKNTVIPEGVTSIDPSAFRRCQHLASITIPNSITSIDPGSFHGCSGLKTVIIGEGMRSIGYDAFAGCINLTSINIPNSITSIGLRAFDGCSNLIVTMTCYNVESWFGGNSYIKGVIFDDGVKNIMSDAFARCTNLSSVTFGNTVANIGSEAFRGCTGLSSIIIPKNIASTGKCVFLQCDGLTSATILCPNVDNMFAGNTSIANVILGEEVTSLKQYAFRGCSGLESISIPNGVTSIASSSFEGCSSLCSILFEDGESILEFGDNNVFYGCPLKDVYLGRNIKFYSSYTPFSNNRESICSLTFGNTVSEIPENAFSGLRNLNQLTLPESLTKIGKMAFYGCESLTELSIPGNVTEIGQQAFDLCRGLKKLTFEDGSEELTFTADPNNLNNSFCNSPLEEIYMGRDFVYKDSSPFFALEPLKTLTFGNNVKNIPNKAFAGCGALKSITIGSNVENIGALAFSACLGLKNVDSYAETAPQVASDAFNNIEVSTIPLKVPENSLDEYWNHPVWSKFWIITEAGAITIKAKDYTRFYGDENPTFEFDTEGAELKGVPSITCSAKPISPVGKYNIEVTRGTVANYEANYVDGTLTITKAPLTISVGEYTMNQYEPMPEFEIVYEGFKNGETESVLTSKPTITYEANEESAPGEYDIILSGAEAENYEMQYVVGKLIINEPASYNLIYMVDGEEYQSFNLKTRDSITPLEEPTKEGYTFSGWSEIPETMPNHDVVVTGIFTVNSYTVTFMYGDKVLHTEEVNYGEAIPLPELEDEYGLPIKWLDVPETMPAHDIVILVDETDAIGATLSNGEPFDVYSVDGKKIRHQVTSLKGLRSGMYIINGRKVMVK